MTVGLLSLPPLMTFKPLTSSIRREVSSLTISSSPMPLFNFGWNRPIHSAISNITVLASVLTLRTSRLSIYSSALPSDLAALQIGNSGDMFRDFPGFFLPFMHYMFLSLAIYKLGLSLPQFYPHPLLIKIYPA